MTAYSNQDQLVNRLGMRCTTGSAQNAGQADLTCGMCWFLVVLRKFVPLTLRLRPPCRDIKLRCIGGR